MPLKEDILYKVYWDYTVDKWAAFRVGLEEKECLGNTPVEALEGLLERLDEETE